MTELSHSLERTVTICAQRATVYRYFTDSERWAAWWGEGSRIEPHPGGRVEIRYPNGITASGEVVELVEDERIVFTFGYDSGEPIPAGASRVAITLADAEAGTRLELRHELADAGARDAHVPGWRYQLALFANVAANDQHAGLAQVVDRYFSAWSETDADRRREALAASVTADVTFRDAHGATAGIDELVAHIGLSQHHFPQATIARSGVPRHCQGTAVVDWAAHDADGKPQVSGSNVVELAPDGRIRRLVGLWAPPS